MQEGGLAMRASGGRAQGPLCRPVRNAILTRRVEQITPLRMSRYGGRPAKERTDQT